jgi:hypothetical protein
LSRGLLVLFLHLFRPLSVSFCLLLDPFKFFIIFFTLLFNLHFGLLNISLELAQPLLMLRQHSSFFVYIEVPLTLRLRLNAMLLFDGVDPELNSRHHSGAEGPE